MMVNPKIWPMAAILDFHHYPISDKPAEKIHYVPPT